MFCMALHVPHNHIQQCTFTAAVNSIYEDIQTSSASRETVEYDLVNSYNIYFNDSSDLKNRRIFRVKTKDVHHSHC